MFFTAFFLAVVTIVYFIVGILSQKVVCESFRNPANSQLLEVADTLLDLNKTAGVNANIREILMNCHKNHSIYNVFNLTSVFDINKVDDYLEEYSIQDKLNELAGTIDVNLSGIKILDQEAKDRLMELGASGIDNIEFYRFTNVVSNKLHFNVFFFLLKSLAYLTVG